MTSPTALAPPPVIALLNRSVDLAFLKPAFEAACCWQSPPGLLATLQNLAAVRAGRPAALAVDLSLGD